MAHEDAGGDAGPLPLFALEELQDYLHIFEETSRPGLGFRIEDNALTVTVDGRRAGAWCLIRNALVFEGVANARVTSLQAAVLHTLKVVERARSYSRPRITGGASRPARGLARRGGHSAGSARI